MSCLIYFKSCKDKWSYPREGNKPKAEINKDETAS